MYVGERLLRACRGAGGPYGVGLVPEGRLLSPRACGAFCDVAGARRSGWQPGELGRPRQGKGVWEASRQHPAHARV